MPNSGFPTNKLKHHRSLSQPVSEYLRKTFTDIDTAQG